MSVQSGTVEGFSVVLWPGACHVSKGFFHGTLESVRRHGELQNTLGEVLSLSPHQINIIKAWAKAHGYKQERRRAKTPDKCYTEAGTTFTAEQWRSLDTQRALPFDAPAPKARRRARAG